MSTNKLIRATWTKVIWTTILATLLPFVLVAALPLALSGCPDWVRQAQIQTANSVAQAANAALPMLVEAYRQEGLRAIDDVKAKGGTEQEARAAIESVKTKWKPIWEAWAALRIAEDAWADALEQDTDTGAALAGLRSAYCQFMARWPSAVPVIPLAPVICGSAT
jgi:hypothetical protein